EATPWSGKRSCSRSRSVWNYRQAIGKAAHRLLPFVLAILRPFADPPLYGARNRRQIAVYFQLGPVAVLGATGNLGQHVARQVLARGWSLSVAVRSRSRLAPEVSERAQVTDIDLSSAKLEELAAFAEGQDAFVCCAGVVTEGEGFVTLVDRLVSALETIQRDRRPVS